MYTLRVACAPGDGSTPPYLLIALTTGAEVISDFMDGKITTYAKRSHTRVGGRVLVQ
jgi:hypothetical protein